MSYIEKFLSSGEEVRVRGRLHWIYWAGAWAALILLGVFVVGVVIFARQVIFMNTTEVAVTDRRVILKKGLLERRVRDIGLETIESASVDQDIWGRMLDYGRVTVRGTGDVVMVTPLIAGPANFRRDLETARFERDVPKAKT